MLKTKNKQTNNLNVQILDLKTSISISLLQFLRATNLTAEEAVDMDIVAKLLTVPRKSRKKYGQRREVSHEERAAISRERNREHASATRRRKKIFQEVSGKIILFDFFLS
jgi:hypothetical protein